MNSAPEPKNKGFWRDTIQFIIIAGIIIIPFRMFVAQPFIVNGTSMDPTFKSGEYLIVDQITYRFNKPERDSVLIFKYPQEQNQKFIKRVIGLPGETISINKGAVTIKNKDNPTGFVLENKYITHPKQDTLEITLKENEYYVMGDNRLESFDSRYWGPLTEDLIIGRPLLRLLPLNKIAVFPGDLSK